MTTPRNPVASVTGVIGLMLALAAFGHGFFEMLQGNQPTPGLIIDAIGPEHVFWAQGQEPALTLLPSYLASGLAVSGLCAALVLWSLAHMRRPGPVWPFIVLMLALTLTGGGIGHVIFYIPAWLWATRANAPLAWWRRVLRPGCLGRLWPWTLGLMALAWAAALELAMFGWLPGVSDADTIMATCLSLLGIAFALLNLSYIAAIADRIGRARLSSGPAAADRSGSR